MSRANARVLFPDGSVKYGIYNGTVDVFWPFLFDTADEAWSNWEEYYKQPSQGYSKWESQYDPERDGNICDVEIANDYGYGQTYLGRANKHQITSDTDIDNMDSVKRGLPDWWGELK